MSERIVLGLDVVSDAHDATSDLRDVGGAAMAMAADIEQASAKARSAAERIDDGLASTAEHADTVASKGSQAAGALAGLGDLVGGPFGGAMVVGGTAMQAFADAGDLVNVVTESNIVKKTKDIVVTTAQTVATKAAAVATRGMAIAQRVLNLAMRANPIGLVIAAVLALVAVIVIAYKRSETFRNIVQAVMRGARVAVQMVVDKIGDLVSWVRDKAPRAWEVLKSAVLTVWRVVSAPTRLYLNILGDLIGFAKDKIPSAFSVMKTKVSDLVTKVRGLFDQMLAPIKAVKDAVQSVIDAIGRIHLPKIKLPDVNPFSRSFDGSRATAGAGSAAAGDTYKITLNGVIGDEATLARYLEKILADNSVRMGRTSTVVYV